MPERITHALHWLDSLWQALTLAVLGALLGLGQYAARLRPDEPWDWRQATGRALVSAGLGMAAGGFLALFPDLHPLALFGIAGALVSLGRDGIERILSRFLNAWGNRNGGI